MSVRCGRGNELDDLDLDDLELEEADMDLDLEELEEMRHRLELALGRVKGAIHQLRENDDG